MKKRLLLYLMVLSLILTVFAVPAFATEVDGTEGTIPDDKGTPQYGEETEEPTQAFQASGQCGDDMYWTYGNGILTISGTGKMYDYAGGAPWAEYKYEITQVIFQGDITYIGISAFQEYDQLQTVDFGNSMNDIGEKAFKGCDSLTAVSLPATFRNFGEEAFRNCKNLKEFHFAGGVMPHFSQNCMFETYAKIYYPADKPWNVYYIAQLEENMHGRIEVLGSDGSDPYEPPKEDQTPANNGGNTGTGTGGNQGGTGTEGGQTNRNPQPNVTEPQQTVPPETQAPDPTVPTVPVEPEKKSGGTGIWIAIGIIVLILGVVGLTELFSGDKRRDDEDYGTDSMGPSIKSMGVALVMGFVGLGALIFGGKRSKGSGSRRPDSGNRRPDSGNRRPDSGSRRPDGGSRRPDSGNRRPDGGSRRPDGGSRRPDSGNRRPDSGNRRPDSGNRRSDGGSRRPDGGNRGEYHR